MKSFLEVLWAIGIGLYTISACVGYGFQLDSLGQSIYMIGSVFIVVWLLSWLVLNIAAFLRWKKRDEA